MTLRLMRTVAALSLWAAATSTGTAQDFLWSGIDPLGHPVGHMTRTVIDPARSIEGLAVNGRPIRLQVWYPAAPSESGEPMSWGDYLAPPRTEPELGAYDDLLDAREASTASRQFFGEGAQDKFERLRDVPVPARRDADPAAGRFPLLIYSVGRNDFQQEATAMWEGLASHGFVIVVTPQIAGSMTEHRFEFSSDALHLQADDALFAAETASDWSFVDASRRYYAGHSSGGAVAAMAALRDPAARGLVSFDGVLSTGDGVALFPALGIELSDLPPGLAITRPDSNVHDAALLGGWDGVVTIGYPRALHFDFQNWPLYLDMVGEGDSRSDAARPRAYAAAVHRSAVRAVIAFLVALEKNEDFAQAALDAARSEPVALAVE